MNLEQPCIRISVRNLVEFILRHGDIDNRTGGADKDAMQQGSRVHRKIQRQQGAEYRAEVPLRYQIPCDGFILSVEGRADGIIELPKRVVVDEIKGVFKDLKRLEEHSFCIWHRQNAMHIFMQNKKIWKRSECR